MWAILPVILIIASITFWYIYVLIKKDERQNVKNYIIGTIVILLFLVHPDITKQTLSIFNCTKVEDKYYLTEEINQECYDKRHTFMIIVIAIPSLVLWIFGIPLLALLALIRNKATILRFKD
jgi:beta-lactamase regulating signal transducer with metallopeptidase domain